MKSTINLRVDKGDFVRAQSMGADRVAVDFLSADEPASTSLALMGPAKRVQGLLLEALNACSLVEPGGPSVRGISGEPDE